MYPPLANPAPENPRWIWRKSTRCTEQSKCVEVALQDQLVVMRDSKSPRQMLRFTAEAWRAFVADVKIGEFD